MCVAQPELLSHCGAFGDERFCSLSFLKYFSQTCFLFVSKIHMLQFLGKLCLIMKVLPLLSQNSSLSFFFAVNKDKWLCSLKAEVLCQSHHINMFSFSLALVSGKKMTALLISFILLLVSNPGVMIHKQTHQDYFIQPKADVQNVIILDRDFSL